MTGHPMGTGMDVILEAKRMKQVSRSTKSGARHRKVLAYFVNKRQNSEYFYFVSFKTLAKDLGHTEAEMRRSARYLARKKLTEYGKGLFHDDGTVAGSGYAATSFGSAVSRLLEDDGDVEDGEAGL